MIFETGFKVLQFSYLLMQPIPWEFRKMCQYHHLVLSLKAFVTVAQVHDPENLFNGHKTTHQSTFLN